MCEVGIYFADFFLQHSRSSFETLEVSPEEKPFIEIKKSSRAENCVNK